jgi:hypothetical protein
VCCIPPVLNIEFFEGEELELEILEFLLVILDYTNVLDGYSYYFVFLTAYSRVKLVSWLLSLSANPH